VGGSEEYLTRQLLGVAELADTGQAHTGVKIEVFASAAFADAHRPLEPPLLRRLDLRLAARQACDALESRARDRKSVV
jgi:hypothetical protein